jgi:hypothetical protein
MDNKTVKKPHEKPLIGIVLCKSTNKDLQKALPDIDELRRLLAE